jgi:hypothetical protein
MRARHVPCPPFFDILSILSYGRELVNSFFALPKTLPKTKGWAAYAGNEKDP